MVRRLVIISLVLWECICLVHSLRCLQCDNVPKPRMCRSVAECYADEICGVERVIDAFNVELYNVGCMRKTKCQSSNTTHHCIDCCSSDLCNVNGCGESGYKQVRGPICYNCPIHTDPKFCHSIDVCGIGEVCMFDAARESGELVFSSTCSDIHACRKWVSHESAIVGRDTEGIMGRKNSEVRSATEHVCRQCCETDLCNVACNGSDVQGPCSPNPCVHGTCHEVDGSFLCVCEQDFGGNHCNISKDYCYSNPCYNGQCYNGRDSFICVCDDGFSGQQCNKPTSHCTPNPCVHGQCYDVSNGSYICVCNDGFEGTRCNISKDYCYSNPCYNGQCYNGRDSFICVCNHGSTGKQCNTSFVDLVHDCTDIIRAENSSKSGIYRVSLWKTKQVIEIYCDMDTDGGGWTVFQRRFNGSVNFTRSFAEYENGFGTVLGEFWLGLKYTQEMVSSNTSELRLDLTAADGTRAYEVFRNFSLGSAPGYRLHIERGSGTAGDSIGLSFNNNHIFVAYDRDSNHLCAKIDLGGWWYSDCAYANLNGVYLTPYTISSGNSGEAGMTYASFQGIHTLKETRMMFRKV